MREDGRRRESGRGESPGRDLSATPIHVIRSETDAIVAQLERKAGSKRG